MMQKFAVQSKCYYWVRAILKGAGIKKKHIKEVRLKDMKKAVKDGMIPIVAFKYEGSLWKKYKSKLGLSAVVLHRPVRGDVLVRTVKRIMDSPNPTPNRTPVNSVEVLL